MLHMLVIKYTFAFLAVAANIPPGFGHLRQQQMSKQEQARELQSLCRNDAFVACDPPSNNGEQGAAGYGFQMCVDLGGAGKLNVCTPTPFPNSGATFRPTDTCGCCGGKCPNREACTCGCIDSINGNAGILMETTQGGRSFCAAGTYEIEEAGLEISLPDMLINLADSPFGAYRRVTNVAPRL